MEENPLDEKQTPSMGGLSKMGKIVGVNLAIFLVQAGLIYGLDGLGGSAGELAMLFGILLIFSLPIQLLVNLVLSMINFAKGNTQPGISYLLSIVVVFLVGYSVCGGYGILGL